MARDREREPLAGPGEANQKTLARSDRHELGAEVMVIEHHRPARRPKHRPSRKQDVGRVVQVQHAGAPDQRTDRVSM